MPKRQINIKHIILMFYIWKKMKNENNAENEF